MDSETREAIASSAEHICTLINETVPWLVDEPLTPARLIYRLDTYKGDVPDGKGTETYGTLRGLAQRVYHLRRALHNDVGEIWKRYWSEKHKKGA